MNKCPFLSTVDEIVECFKDCVFHEYKDTDGMCPFKQVTTFKEFDFDGLERFDFLSEDKDSLINMIYNS